MITLVALVPFAAGLVLGAFTVWPLAHRAGLRAAARDAEEIKRILTGVEVPVVRPAPVPDQFWARPTPPRIWHNPAPRALAAHASQRVASTPATYRPKHAALVMAHLKADTYIGRPPVMAELVSAS